jgi:hypothetical protein
VVVDRRILDCFLFSSPTPSLSFFSPYWCSLVFIGTGNWSNIASFIIDLLGKKLCHL